MSKPYDNYFISGASGFIGSNVVSYLINSGISYSGISRAEHKDNNISICDLSDVNIIKKLLKHKTCLIHCAGYAHDFKVTSSKVKSEIWQTNYEGTKNLIKAAAICGVTKFINLSSVKVYGDVGEDEVGENYITKPVSEYAKSKLASERFIIEYGRKHNINVVNLRLSMVYGDGAKGNLTRMASMIKKKLFPPLPETKNKKSLVHINDVVEAIFVVAKSPKATFESFNIVGPTKTSTRNLYNNLREVLGINPTKFEISNSILVFLAKIVDIMQIIFKTKFSFNSDVLKKLMCNENYSSKKIHEFIGWAPKIKLKEGLLLTYSKNRNPDE